MRGWMVAGNSHRQRLKPLRCVLAAGVPAALLALAGFARAELPANFQNGKAGYVVAHFAYALSPKDAREVPGACPEGVSLGPAQIIAATPEGKQREGESEADYARRMNQMAFAFGQTRDGKNVCTNPESAGPDPKHFRTIVGNAIPVDGIDLDGQDSRAKGKPAGNTCAHDDFTSPTGQHGIDNQFYRVVGCSQSFQPTGMSNSFEIEMHTGAWGVLITLSGVDDLKNDPDVEVGIAANADPIQLSPSREPLADSTYAIDQDPRFQAKTHGRIVNGVLTTDPVDMRFHLVTNSIRLERPIRDARLLAHINADGSLEGYLAGYTPVEDMYDYQFGFRNGKDGAGKPANPRLITGSANGQARVLGWTCNGAYYALKQFADGHRDPVSGQCTSISTQYKFKAIPAFVVSTNTHSVNENLDKPK